VATITTESYILIKYTICRSL